jgi:hypothetical protein
VFRSAVCCGRQHLGCRFPLLVTQAGRLQFDSDVTWTPGGFAARFTSFLAGRPLTKFLSANIAKKAGGCQQTDKGYCERHRHLGDRFIPESNAVMAKSYLLLDEYMRFLDKGNGIEKTSESILKVSVAEALSQVEWDVESFEKRGGIFDWRKEVPQSGRDCGSAEMGKLDW